MKHENEILKHTLPKATLILIRGVSGSGKSTLAAQFVDQWTTLISADDYFTDENGNYNWKPELLPKAHDWCLNTTRKFLQDVYYDTVVVHNTFTTQKHLQPYLDLKEGLKDVLNLTIHVITVENHHGGVNVHDVPEHALKRQSEQLRQSIKLR